MGNRFQSLDFLKGIGCIGVVFIHYSFPGISGEIVHKLSEFAVPVFIMITGYFAYGCDEKQLTKRLWHITKIFVFTYLLYFMYVLCSCLNNNTAINWIQSLLSFRALAYAVVFCTIDFAVHLWYFIAVIETYLAWILIAKYKKIDTVEHYNYLFFLFGIVLTIVVETYDLDWSYKVNFIGRALPWFVFGHKMHGAFGNKKLMMDNWKLCVLTFLSVIVSLIPAIVDTTINFSYIGVVGYAVGTFIIALKNTKIKNHKSKIMLYIGKELSLYVYVFHVLIAAILLTVIRHFRLIDVENVIFLWIWPLLVLGFTIIVASVFSHLSKVLSQFGIMFIKSTRK